MTITEAQSLGEMVAASPASAAVFERLGLDYCCHGHDRLDDACRAAGLDPPVVLKELAEADAGADAVSAGHPADPAALTQYIESVHHAYLQAELPALDALAEKVVGVHGQRHPELSEVRRLLAELRADLEPHLVKEERVLFPAIRNLLEGQREFAFGTVRNPIRMMMLEHDRAGDLLAALRIVTSGYLVPDDGCAIYRSLYERLVALEVDTHQHIHLENNVLFPAAVAIESP